MASAKFEREYSQHLVEQVLRGKMTRRQMLVRASVFGLSLTAAGQLLAACGGDDDGGTAASPSASGAPEPVLGGTITMIGPAPITDPDPVTIYDQGGIVLVYQFLEYLIDLNNDNSLRGKLAESWTPNDAVDVWTFKLRQGVTFNDGTPFEAEDVVTSMERVLDPDSGSGALSQLGGVLSPGGTKAIDATTVEFSLDKPFADFPYMVSSGNYNTAILPRTYKGDIVKNPVGTGPFMLDQYVTKQRATFKKNPTYWGKDEQGRQLPYLDGLEYVMVEDNSAQNLQLQSGAIDLQPQTVFQGAQALSRTPTCAWTSTRARASARSPSTRAWNLGTARTASSSARPSPTVSTARPSTRPSTTDAATSGTTPSGSRPCSPAARRPRRARRTTTWPSRLLTEAGSAGGLKVKLTFAKYLENPQLAQLIQEQCKPAGIEIELDQLSYDAVLRGRRRRLLRHHPVDQRGHDHHRVGQPAGAGHLCGGHAAAGWPCGGSSHWDNPDFVSDFDQYQATVDETTRMPLAEKLSQIHAATPRSCCRSTSRSCARRRRTCSGSRVPARSTAT